MNKDKIIHLLKSSIYQNTAYHTFLAAKEQL